MPLTLTLTGGTSGDLDLSGYVRLAEGDGFDPADGDFLAPEFNDATGLGGQGLLNVSETNKELAFPLHLTAASKDALHALVRTLRLKLDEPGVMVKLQDHDATDPTWFDVEYGRFDPDYRHFRARALMLSGVLRCWVRPYGHTATTRIVATFAGSGVLLQTPITSVAGDVGALPVVEFGAQTPGLVGVAVLPYASYVARFPAASISVISGSAILTGASGVAGSQYLRIHKGDGAVAALVGAMGFALSPTGHAGRHRVFGLIRPHASVVAGALLGDDNGSVIGATSIASRADWRLMDLGVASLDRDTANQYPSTRRFRVSFSTPSTSLATPYVDLNEIYVLPDERSVFVGASGANASAVFRVDGVTDRIMERWPSGARSRDGTRRGAIPAIPTGAALAAMIAPAAIETPAGQPTLTPTNQAFSVTVRIRERFTFVR